ncbi:MAG: F0F1 ATP synthase subunit A [Aggregatilineales bacterium]
MNATVRGAIILGGIILFIAACSALTFGVLPASGLSVGMPVIMVPGEPYDTGLPPESFRWTNTLTATVLSTLAVLLFALLAWRASRGWKREVPTRFQSWVELLGGFMYDLTKTMAGRNARLLFPLVATIFVFLLAANWMKLLPGVESVGVMHCAEEGFSGYPAVQVGGAFRLYVDEPLNAGREATYQDYNRCKAFFRHGDIHGPTQEALNAAITELRNREATLIAELDADPTITPDERQARIDALRFEIIETVYPDPVLPLSAEQLAAGAFPYIFVVTPYVRGAPTDLNLTIGLALVAVTAIQIFGVMALGPSYFKKFINLDALGNLGKRPLGAIDFIVGIVEIISEIGKIVSLAFRLFGSMFAGGILLAVMALLIAFFLPIIFYGLEIIITTIQALVFAVLTLVFSAQAMVAHHGDDHHDDHSNSHH